MIGAASPTPYVSPYLAAPPGKDWVESGATTDFLIGTITPESYSKWANDGGSAESALRRHGLITGYGRAWEQKVTRDALSEFVLEFDSPSGATSWYNGLKLFDQTSKYYTKDIPSLATAQSVGVEWTFSDGSHEYAIEFAKGNLFFDVTMDADTNDLAASTLAQAQMEFDTAPAATENVSGGTAPSVPPLIGLAIIGLIFLVGTAVYVLARSSRRQPAFAVTTSGFKCRLTAPAGGMV